MNPKRLLLLASIITCILLCGCSGSSSGPSPDIEPRDNTPKVLKTSAPGDDSYGDDVTTIDASHKNKGYVMIKYVDTDQKIMIIITDPQDVEYKYMFPHDKKYHAFPLTGGDGNYEIKVLQNLKGDTYITAFAQIVDVKLKNEFTPFLSPNMYCNFTKDSKVVAKASELAENAYTDLDVVQSVYDYVIKTIEYDTAKAENVESGYIPDVDATLESETGICFDYASLMVAMLRSQRIPTKLQVGYAGELYHAWISAYIEDIGWVDNIIQFDGQTWTLMDPTLASNNDDSTVKKYVGDGSHYTIKFTY